MKDSLDYIKSARADPDDDGSGAGQVKFLEVKPRIFQCHHCRGIRKLRMSCHSLRLQFGRNMFGGIETLSLLRRFGS